MPIAKLEKDPDYPARYYFEPPTNFAADLCDYLHEKRMNVWITPVDKSFNHEKFLAANNTLPNDLGCIEDDQDQGDCAPYKEGKE